MLSPELTLQVQEYVDLHPDSLPLFQEIEAGNQTFVSNLSHELRNILTLMNSSLQLIETSHPEVSCFNYWKEAKDDCALLQSFLQDLSSFTTGLSREATRFDLGKLLRDACLSCLPLARSRNKQLSFQSISGLFYITGDSNKLYEAFINLIQNALDAIPQKGNVWVSLSTQNHQAVIEVKDNGCGISPERLIHIFEPFITYKTGGSGLGLPIVQKAVDSHGGHICVSSTLQKGSVFSLIFPE